MVGALWTGISGLGGSQSGLDNESNNIANVNTIGFKASRISFADQMYQDRIGKGVTSFDVEKMYTQGSFKITGVSYDMALDGDGFFQVKDGADTYYTRAGNFRMGEGGTLEDVAQNKVQGWAIQPITDDDITATDPNAKFFTNDFTKLLGNKVIRDTTSIETIVAKATDYTTTATTDNKNIFTGAGYKSAATKIADVEALITEYNSALSVYAEADPKPTASSSSTQKDLLDFDTDNPLSLLGIGDEVYAYIDGEKFSVTFEDSDTELTVMQKFADLISDKTGYRAYLADTTSSDPYNPNPTSGTGEVIIEGLVPGQGFRVTEFGWKDTSESNKTTKGDLVTLNNAVLGTGMGHINSVRDALSEAVSGKQTDVFTPDTMVFDTRDNALNDFTYQMEIYDKTLDQTIQVPTTGPVLFNNVTDLDTFVSQFNDPDHGGVGANPLPDYVKAYNHNGNLVIKTLDENYDVEFTGEMTGNSLAKEEQVFTVTGPSAANGDITVFGTNVTLTNGDSSEVIAAKIYAERETIINSWNAAQADNETRQIESISIAGDKLTVTWKRGTTDTNAPLPLGRDIDDAAIGFLDPGATGATLPIDAANSVNGGGTETLLRDPNYSTREGAGAEFLQIETNINQTASKSELQLRLDTLGLTDSAFGAFEVDSTGLITMTQDGARFAIGQVAVARFTDNRGLEPVGDNLLMETTRSGTALFNIDNDKMAEVEGGSLELSTADLSESLVNLMVFQRAFEANAKSITTADTILNTLIQLKR